MRYNKFKTIKTQIDGIVFASKKEAKRYSELKILFQAGLIKNLKVQPEFEIVIKDIKICKYIADFMCFDTKEFKTVIEDVKGMKTPVYRLKKKLVEACYGVKITEI